MADESAERAADLLEMLLLDPAYRASFRKAPAAAAAAAGLTDVAAELERPERALQTLELRESKSSLAGVLMAAAAEGIGVAQFVGFLHQRGSLSADANAAFEGALHRAAVQQAAAAAPAAPDVIDAPSHHHLHHHHHHPAHHAEAAGSAAPAAPAASPAAPDPQGGAPDPQAAAPAPAADPAPAHRPAGSAAPDPQSAAPPPAAPPAPSAAAGGGVSPPSDAPDPQGADDGAPDPQAADGAAPDPQATDGAAPDPQAAGGAAPDPQAAGGAAPDPQAAGGAAPDPQAAGGAAPDPQAAGDGAPDPQAAGDGAPDPQAAAEGGSASPDPTGGDGVDPADAAPAGRASAAGAATFDPQALQANDGGTAADAAVAAAEAGGGGRHATAVAIAHDPNITLSQEARMRLKLTVDPRVIDILDALSKVHPIKVSSISSTSFEITEVDGKPLSADNTSARDLAEALATLKGEDRPSSVGSPWKIGSDGFYSDGDHAGRLTVKLGASSFLTPEAGSGQGGVQFLQTVQQQAEASGASAISADAFAYDGPNPYPGDTAPKWEIALWMSRAAVKAGLPPELPLMASLQESSLSNVKTPDQFGSIGYFQLREFWGAARESPEGQLDWFIQHALATKELNVGRGDAGYGTDPNKYWEWIADTERPAEQYRHLYAKHLGEAQDLLKQAAQQSGIPADKLFVGGGSGGPGVVDLAAEGAGSGGSEKARTAVAAALSQLGVDYSWGGGGPGGPGGGFAQGKGIIGFDCSSLMQYAEAKVGISIPRVAQAQFNFAGGQHIDGSHLQPGDILYFGTPGDIHHTGMYIGNGKFVHAPHTGDVIKISELSGYYLGEFAGARRFT